MMSNEQDVVIHDSDGLRVWATLRDGGSLTIEGQDLSGLLGWAEYEYAMTIKADAVPRLVAELGGKPGDDALRLLHERRDELVRVGEKQWLDDHDVPYSFWNRIEH